VTDDEPPCLLKKSSVGFRLFGARRASSGGGGAARSVYESGGKSRNVARTKDWSCLSEFSQQAASCLTTRAAGRKEGKGPKG